MNDTMDWEKDFRDFFFENGKYKGRKLGVNEYIKFIRALLIFKQAEMVKKGKQEMLDIIQKHEGWEESYEFYKQYI